MGHIVDENYSYLVVVINVAEVENAFQEFVNECAYWIERGMVPIGNYDESGGEITQTFYDPAYETLRREGEYLLPFSVMSTRNKST